MAVADQSEITAHPCGSNPVAVAEPDDAGAFDTGVAVCDTNGFGAGARVKDTELLIATCLE